MLNRLDMTYSVLVCGDSRVTREDHLTIHSITEDNQDHNTKELGGWFTNHLPLKNNGKSIPFPGMHNQNDILVLPPPVRATHFLDM